MKIETVVQLLPEDCGLQHSIVRLHNSNIDSKRLDRERFFRREAVVICNPQNGSRVLRYAMGTPGGISITKRAVALDYDAVDVPPLSGLMSRPLLHSLKHSGAFGDLYASLFR